MAITSVGDQGFNKSLFYLYGVYSSVVERKFVALDVQGSIPCVPPLQIKLFNSLKK